ncbi:hypothetical protein DEU56DRAFT_785527 [Suillus clintonianus]|uniref:uncharacterized protein n=1 Tax=Suillus clintonianus TaxID=1904413 RepID=UPI001B86464E|nr:uncharacterized protein DEU56DRAFT_785527 [Suillus clintonianus]KAG2146627.1 hypothetical protein DEU56DRAFT_785527 [Suillus clintonianus]
MARMFPTSGPCLPPYKSLIIQGDYHPSAPIHMCLSVPMGAKALLLSSSRQALIRSLREYNDEWLLTDSGTGNTCHSSSKVDIFYPPTPNHLVVLLSAFRTHDASEPVPLDAKATLDCVPSLLVLHELSAYFLPMNENKPHTIASYLQLVSHAVALANFLSIEPQTPMRFALFDSQLDNLKLPVLRAPIIPVFDGEENGDETSRSESVDLLAHKYFEWVGTFNKSNPETDFPSDGSGVRRCTLTLHKQGSDIRTDIMWRWSEVLERTHSRYDEPTTTFFWS